MNWSYEMQHVIIRVQEEMYDDESVWCVARIDFGGTDADELARLLGEEIRVATPVGYTIRDERLVENMGAGVSIQHVVLSIVGGAAEAVVSTLIENLWHKLPRQRGTASARYDPERSTDSARRFVEDQFRPAGELKLVDVSLIQSNGKFTFEDAAATRYVVDIDPSESRFLATKIVPD